VGVVLYGGAFDPPHLGHVAVHRHPLEHREVVAGEEREKLPRIAGARRWRERRLLGGSSRVDRQPRGHRRVTTIAPPGDCASVRFRA